MKILLQFPEGLKQKALEFAKKYESDSHEVFLSASSCYGACDLALDEARALNVDKLVHFGHNRFIKGKLPLQIEVEYVPFSIDIDVNKLEAVLPHINDYKKIALGTTVQYIPQIVQMKSFFEKHGKTVYFETGSPSELPGQVLGCDASCIKKVENKVDAVVFVGNGMFHPLAIDFDPSKPVFVFNAYSNEVRDIRADIEKLRKRRRGSLLAAIDCRCFGILVSTKPGQFALIAARAAKKQFETHGLKAEILVANEFDPMSLNNFMSFDCYVNTACPRISDDTEKFEKPVLNFSMLKEFFELLSATKKSSRS